jgi:hypothetical protein
MNLSFSDLAPLIGAAVAASTGLLLTWLAVRQAHGPDRRQGKAEPRAGE